MDVDYSWILEANERIPSASDEIDFVTRDLSSHNIEIRYLQHIVNIMAYNGDNHILANIENNNDEVYDKLVLFVTSYRRNLSLSHTDNDMDKLVLMINPMIIYTDNSKIEYVMSVINHLPKRIVFCDINNADLKLYEMIIGSEPYHSKLSTFKKSKFKYNNPEYMAWLVRKMDYMNDAYRQYLDYSYYAWIEFDLYHLFN